MSVFPPPLPTGRNFAVKLCTTADERERCMAIRNQVFCVEQGYDPAIEVDEKDPCSDHFILTETLEDGSVRDVGTLRCFASGSLLKLGRFAVHSTHRGTGAGRVLEEAFIRHLASRQPGKCGAVTDTQDEEVDVVAYSQCVARGFYERLGWREEGDEFLEEGQPHIKIIKTVRLQPREIRS
ncbi:hypothetical protein JCM10212_006932 [Sporobolomyces blumeae]